MIVYLIIIIAIIAPKMIKVKLSQIYLLSLILRNKHFVPRTNIEIFEVFYRSRERLFFTIKGFKKGFDFWTVGFTCYCDTYTYICPMITTVLDQTSRAI